MAQEEIFTIDQGADVAIEMFIVKKDGNPRNIASHAFNMKMKRSYSSTDSADIIDWATIVSDANAGIMTASLTNTQTDALRKGKYVYDVEMQYVDSDGDTIIERVLQGQMIVSPSVTR